MLAIPVHLSSDVAGPTEAVSFGRLHLHIARYGDSGLKYDFGTTSVIMVIRQITVF